MSELPVSSQRGRGLEGEMLVREIMASIAAYRRQQNFFAPSSVYNRPSMARASSSTTSTSTSTNAGSTARPRARGNAKVDTSADYCWDVFISYPQVAKVARWVANVFAPEVEDGLAVVGLRRAPTVFRDRTSIVPGQSWPNELSMAHARSRVILAVLCHPYFESGWCCSEWTTAAEREEALRRRYQKEFNVVVAVRYNDATQDTTKHLSRGMREHVDACARVDLSPFTTLVDRHSEINMAHDFRAAIAELCERSLRPAILAAPAWDAGWPKLPTEPLAGRSRKWRSRLE
jgi:hypothetical protein